MILFKRKYTWHQNDFDVHAYFEAVYSAPSLQGLPFRVISGNHDHHGNVSAQIAYTDKSSRWYYPDWFYSWTRSYTGVNRRGRCLFHCRCR